MPANTSQPQLVITSSAGQQFKLSPVPMSKMPSESAASWLRFLGAHVAGSDLDATTCARVQAFMREHRTEALTDGAYTYTLAGSSLSFCDPEAA